MGASSEYWVERSTEENRQVSDENMYTGVIKNYMIKQGWGFLCPDDISLFPEEMQTRILEQEEELRAKGKEVEETLIYFRKPDLVKGFMAVKEAPVTFMLYLDDKGVGAYEINGAEAA